MYEYQENVLRANKISQPILHNLVSAIKWQWVTFDDMPAQVLVPRQVVLPRRGVVAQLALVLFHLAAVDALDVLLQDDRAGPEVAPGALVAVLLGDLCEVPSQLLVPVEVVFSR